MKTSTNGSWIKSTKRTASIAAALIVAAVGCCMPQRVIWVVGSAAGRMFFMFPSRAKRIAARNIDLCFPTMSVEARRLLVRSHLQMCGVAILSVGVAWMAPAWRIRSLVRMRGQEHLDKVISDGKNVILLTPHMVALEICGIRVSLDRKMVTMYRRSANRLLHRMSTRRTRFGIDIVEREQHLRSLIRQVRGGMPLYYLPDQDVASSASVFVPFCGVEALTVTSLSRMARMTGAVILPCIPSILPGGKGYEVRFLEPIANFPTADLREDARRMNEEIESWIREMPNQYMWTSRRFKTRRPGELSLYARSAGGCGDVYETPVSGTVSDPVSR